MESLAQFKGLTRGTALFPLFSQKQQISYFLIDENSRGRIGIARQARRGEDEEEPDCGERKDAHEEVRHDVDQIGPSLASHNSHESAQKHNRTGP